MSRRKKPPIATMSPSEYVDTLYQACLGRPADSAGLKVWVKLLEDTGDPTAVLDGLFDSEEARLHRGPTSIDCGPIALRALEMLGRRPRIVDIGAQLIGDGTHAYTPLETLTPLDVVGFDPLAERMAERAASETYGEGSLTLLPYAIGDGSSHTLYINNDDATTSLFPLNAAHNARFNHLSTLHTTRTEKLETHRLDDVIGPEPIDFLKLDVQGGELMVLKGAAAALARTALIHCEVEFSPIYEGQPLYPEIQAELATHGFYLLDLLVPGRYHYITKSGQTAEDHLLWADAVFVRETDDRETLAAQALIAAAVYSRPTLAEHLLERATT